MGESTGISWTNATWNPWRGCLKISPGCKQCYMYREQIKYGNDPAVIVRAADDTFSAPLAWATYWENPNRKPRKQLPPKPGDMIFTCSWSDWFIEQADAWRDEAWEIVRNTPYIYQLLTKRPENIRLRLPKDWEAGWPNVWLGVSIESQKYLERAEILANIPATLRFISYEPALELVNFRSVLSSYQWLISGGESGYDPRPAQIEWFESARDQCYFYGVAYFHKQNGGREKIDGAWGGKRLKGQLYQAFPDFHLPPKEYQQTLF